MKTYLFMKKDKLLVAFAVGVGAAAVGVTAYKLLSKDIPDGAIAVEPFDKARYMGSWNEIARLPNFVENNLKNVIEEYTDNGDGTFKVVTRVLNFKTNELKELTGIIKSAGAEDVGMLKVSYLGPLFLAYNVLDIDDDYKYALVSGSSINYLWILSRENSVPDDIKQRFLKLAQSIGFAIEKLEWPEILTG